MQILHIPFIINDITIKKSKTTFLRVVFGNDVKTLTVKNYWSGCLIFLRQPLLTVTYVISVVAKFATTEYHYNHLKKFITSLTIVSFSSGLDSAIINVIATRALLEIICLSSMIRCLFLLRNSKNKEAPILLQPSAKG